jgi:hypothetical protein
MAYIQTKNPSLDIFWRVLQWKMLLHIYFMAIWSILRLLNIFCRHLVCIFYSCLVYFPRFGKLYKKSGNPARQRNTKGGGGGENTSYVGLLRSVEWETRVRSAKQLKSNRKMMLSDKLTHFSSFAAFEAEFLSCKTF